MRKNAWLGCFVVCMLLGLVPGAATPSGAAVPTVPAGAEFLAAGVSHSCAVTSSGTVKCWGGNAFGSIGDGTTTDRLVPTAVGSISGIESVSGGWGHTCAVTGAGAVKCWGNNWAGQLGDGTSGGISTTPLDVSGLGSGVSVVSAGVFHTCAVTDAGGAKCWGANDKGQLGDGTTNGSSTPVDVVGLSSGVVAVATSWRSTCALTGDGGVKCWGHNNVGQLGDGTTIDRLTPVDVDGLTAGVLAISAEGGTPDSIDGSHACAVTASGGVKCWGYNGVGQLGDGTTTSRPAPVDVSGLGSGVAGVTVADRHTCARTAGGGVKCWGENVAGKLGDGTTTNRLTPVDVVGLGSGIVTISAGEFHSCAVTGAGGVKCWGAGALGRLGNGVTEDSHVPVDVSGSFYRDECPTIVAESNTGFSMSDGYGVGSVATFTADPGYVLVGDATLTCLGDTTWDGPPPTAESSSSLTVVPDTSLSGGQTVSVELEGFPPGVALGWCQAVAVEPPSASNCGQPIGLGTAGPDGALTGFLRLARFIHVPSLARWVDCASPGEACVVGAADLSDIGSARVAPLEFATPPAPPTTRGTVGISPVVVPGGGTVGVAGSGFRAGAAIDLYQCRSAPDDPSDCSTLRATATADAGGQFLATMPVTTQFAPSGGANVDCRSAPDACVVAAAEAVDLPGTIVGTPVDVRVPVTPFVVPGVGSVEEGNAGSAVVHVPVRLSAPTTVTVTVQYVTIYGPGVNPPAPAEPGVDFESVSGMLTFAPGETVKSVPVTVSGDEAEEPDEWIVLMFGRPTNARMGGFWGLGFGVIVDDDAPAA